MPEKFKRGYHVVYQAGKGSPVTREFCLLSTWPQSGSYDWDNEQWERVDNALQFINSFAEHSYGWHGSFDCALSEMQYQFEGKSQAFQLASLAWVAWYQTVSPESPNGNRALYNDMVQFRAAWMAGSEEV